MPKGKNTRLQFSVDSAIWDMYQRYLKEQIERDLSQKMVFIAGPRQVGKTTLARSVITDSALYLNWDISQHREIILREKWPAGDAIIFDEIHKYRRWRNLLKGFYDQFGKERKILVTGSARLDYYRRGGDSLQGRYYFLRMHPLSVAELKLDRQSDLHTLAELGGFPEPYFSGSKTTAKRFSRDYRTRLIEEDLASLENVKDLSMLELLAVRLPELVGSPLSVNALREDLQVSHKAVASWIDIFERLYYIFRIKPFGATTIRAVKKEQKHYHFNWSLIENEAIRFENMVAAHLLKWVEYRNDTEGEEYELRYFRDIDRREVDFIICLKNKPVMAIECKLDDRPIEQALKYFKNKFKAVAAWQIALHGKQDYVSGEGIRVAPALILLKTLV